MCVHMNMSEILYFDLSARDKRGEEWALCKLTIILFFERSELMFQLQIPFDRKTESLQSFGDKLGSGSDGRKKHFYGIKGKQTHKISGKQLCVCARTDKNPTDNISCNSWGYHNGWDMTMMMIAGVENKMKSKDRVKSANIAYSCVWLLND